MIITTVLRSYICKSFLYFVFLFFSPLANAATGDEIAVGAIGLVLCAALVFFMQAGFALLESGMVRAKNSINVIMKNYTDLCAGIIVFWAFGYGIMFGGQGGLYPDKNVFFISNLSSDGYIVFLYHMLFAATASTIISGAVAERMRYWSYVVISIVVTGFIYPVYGSWAWSDSGWLFSLGFIDLAGASVVHAVGGWCALAAAMVVGPRTGRFGRDGSVRDIPGHSLPYIALGGFILWLGWFGFNAGSAQSINDLGAILINTQLAGSGGAIGALMLMVATRRAVLMTTTVNAALGGLVASCAGAAVLSPGFALLTGLIAGAIVVLTTQALISLKIDDVVGAVSVHGFAGSWGVLAAGLFYSGDMFDVTRVSVQLLGVFAAFAWGFGATFAVLKILNSFAPMRASKLHEQRGLDFTEHYEIGYTEFQSSVTHKGKQSNLSSPSQSKTA